MATSLPSKMLLSAPGRSKKRSTTTKGGRRQPKRRDLDEQKGRRFRPFFYRSQSRVQKIVSNPNVSSKKRKAKKEPHLARGRGTEIKKIKARALKFFFFFAADVERTSNGVVPLTSAIPTRALALFFAVLMRGSLAAGQDTFTQHQSSRKGGLQEGERGYPWRRNAPPPYHPHAGRVLVTKKKGNLLLLSPAL